MTIPPKAQSGDGLADLVERFAALYESQHLSDTPDDVNLNRYRAHLAMGEVLSAIRERMLGEKAVGAAVVAHLDKFSAGHDTEDCVRAAIAAAIGVGRP